MARYFAQAQRKDADATKPPGPGYVGAINDEYLKHKITEMMKAFERMTKKVFGQNVVQLTSLKNLRHIKQYCCCPCDEYFLVDDVVLQRKKKMER